MAVRICIPTALARFAANQETVEVGGATVAEALTNLQRTFPDLGRHLLAPEGRLRSYVRLYVNDEDFRALQREQTPLADGDVVMIVPSIAGGAR